MFLLLNGNLVSQHTQLLIGAAIFVYRFRLFVLFPMLLRYVHIKICIKSVKVLDRWHLSRRNHFCPIYHSA